MVLPLVQSLTAESLGATDLFDYTGRVLELVSGSVQSGRDTAQCCGYRYQMLDKYCTSRTMVHNNYMHVHVHVYMCCMQMYKTHTMYVHVHTVYTSITICQLHNLLLHVHVYTLYIVHCTIHCTWYIVQVMLNLKVEYRAST